MPPVDTKSDAAPGAPSRRPLRVLRVLTRPNLGGPTRQAIALWHAHREQDVETLLVTGRVDAGEVELSPRAHGVPAAPGDARGPGVLELPELGRGVDPFGDRRATRALTAIARAFEPDVVHTHTSKAGVVGRRAAFAAGAPVVAHTFHGHVLRDYFGPLASWWLRRLERRLAVRTQLLFAVSPSCADELAALGVAPRERFEVVPPAVVQPAHRTRAHARRELGIEPDEFRVCAVGRLVPIKRLEHFVTMVSQEPRLAGDIVGDGAAAFRDGLQRRIDAEAPKRVRLLGARPDVAALLPAWDALVLPSVREGCPLVAVEAFAAGVPVVGYDVPGVRDALQHFGRGVLVAEHEGPAGLLRALQRLREDSDATAAQVDAAREAAATCAPAAVAARLATAYRKIRAGSCRSSYHLPRQG